MILRCAEAAFACDTFAVGSTVSGSDDGIRLTQTIVSGRCVCSGGSYRLINVDWALDLQSRRRSKRSL